MIYPNAPIELVVAVSPHQRRATNKRGPEFHRKHGEVLTFGLIGTSEVQRSSSMSTTQKDKSSGKPRQRSRKGDQRQKPEAQPAPQRDEAMEDQISTLMADAT